jgi:hypothetical protein
MLQPPRDDSSLVHPQALEPCFFDAYSAAAVITILSSPDLPILAIQPAAVLPFSHFQREDLVRQ